MRKILLVDKVRETYGEAVMSERKKGMDWLRADVRFAVVIDRKSQDDFALSDSQSLLTVRIGRG